MLTPGFDVDDKTSRDPPNAVDAARHLCQEARVVLTSLRGGPPIVARGELATDLMDLRAVVKAVLSECVSNNNNVTNNTTNNNNLPVIPEVTTPIPPPPPKNALTCDGRVCNFEYFS